jgi:hypothetical protein
MIKSKSKDDLTLLVKNNNLKDINTVMDLKENKCFIRKEPIDINEITNNEWSVICRRYYLEEPFINAFKTKIDWKEIVKNQAHISVDYLLENVGCIINWYIISGYDSIGYNFWFDISKHRKLSIDEIDRVIDFYLNKYYKENHYVLYSNNIFWYNLCYFQEWNEPLLKKYKKYVDWIVVVNKQKLSNNFIYMFIDNIDFYVQKNIKNHPFTTMPFSKRI